jgi:hypothetical protein
MRINRFMNELYDRDGVLVRSPGRLRNVSSQPQDMRLQPHMLLLGHGQGRRILNGVEYVVAAVDGEHVWLDMALPFRRNRDGLGAEELEETRRAEEGIKLTHAEAARSLRLRYAMCYATVQGRTIAGQHILLLNSDNRHFTTRTLIVGLSRVADGGYVHLPTPEQEEELFRLAPPLPEEPYADEEEPEDEEQEESDGE